MELPQHPRKSHPDAGGGLWDYTGHCGRLVLSKGLQHCCGTPLESAAEEDVQDSVNKHKMTPQGQAVTLCQPAKLFWEDFVLFQYCLLGETRLQKRRRMAEMLSAALPCDLLRVRGLGLHPLVQLVFPLLQLYIELMIISLKLNVPVVFLPCD